MTVHREDNGAVVHESDTADAGIGEVLLVRRYFLVYFDVTRSMSEGEHVAFVCSRLCVGAEPR